MLNHNTPFLPVWIRKEFLYNLTKGHGEFVEAHLFGITSLRERALMFNVVTVTGAHFRWLPAHALLHKDPKECDLEHLYLLSELQLWNCFSYRPTVIQWDYLLNHECVVALRNRKKLRARYAFTVDWLPEAGLDTSFCAEAEQNKCGHVLLLENGQIAVQPTNRVVWCDAYFIGNEPTAASERYLTNTHQWIAETCERWSVAESDEHFYEPRESAETDPNCFVLPTQSPKL